MKRISIYEYEGTNLHDITLFDLEAEEIERYHVSGITFSEAIKVIDNLITEYNLQPTDTITNYVFDSNGYTLEVIKETNQEYLQ